MRYTTYISAAEKLSALGQKEIAKKFLSHANDIVTKRISEFDFDILVGQVKHFNGAKFAETRVLREKEANTIMFIFKSGTNTHRINTTLRHNGEIVWHEGNHFCNRKSVKSFEKLIGVIVEYSTDIQKLLTEMQLNQNKLRLIQRTFYL
jgi:hypothetical protein